VPTSPTAPAQSSGEPSYRRLTDDQRSTILDLYAKGHPQTAIGQLLGVDDSTINRVVKKYASTLAKAKQRIEANAEPAVETLQKLMRNSKRPDVQYKAAAKFIDSNGLGGNTANVSVGVQVMVGDRDRPALDAQTITVQAVKE